MLILRNTSYAQRKTSDKLITTFPPSDFTILCGKSWTLRKSCEFRGKEEKKSEKKKSMADHISGLGQTEVVSEKPEQDPRLVATEL